MPFLDKLWHGQEDDDYKPQMPESGTFVNAFSGEWSSSLMHRLWVEEGINLDNLRLPYAGRQILASGSGAFYYWKNSRQGFADASRACAELGRKYGPNLTWRWEMPMKTILGWTSEKDPVETFGELRSQDVDISPLSSKKSRHRYHMIVLPSALQTLALADGLIKEPVYDFAVELSKLTELIDAGVDLTAKQQELIGDDKVYAESVLWKVRKEIWKVYGEENVASYTVGQGGKFDVSSPKMERAMGLVYSPQKFWATITEVPDPHAEAITKAGKHLNTFVLSKLFDTKEQAIAECGALNGDGEAVDVALPAGWANIGGVTPEDWLNTVRELASKLELRGKDEATQRMVLNANEADLKETYYCTVDDVLEGMKAI